MNKWRSVKWLCILFYLAALFWVWRIHLPVRNIFLYFLIFITLTCLLLIAFSFIPDNEKKEG